ncbi:hypothetical protein MITSMUL_04033 [Mitsuokella multacida DSM 20544]|uniref:Uncharacterized protein n=1 Tax=Mitsuokella multacida DSM 20544 TaxID=500635 RepID=C9KLD2_9FIRM|nr:hypothetical protein MITSMUL_04033 [Mitsuokella multacida DSM 20544]
MLHCLVFKEQLGLSKLAFLLSFESCSLQATFISYRIERSLSRSFFFLFFKFVSASCKSLANQGLRAFASAVSLSDLYYITG